MKIQFNKPNIDKHEIKAVTEVLKSGWITTGPVTETLEKEFAEYVGAKYAIAVNSCTTALAVSLRAHKINKTKPIAVPSFTFAATVEAIVNYGATPYFVDITDELLGDFTNFGMEVGTLMPVFYSGKDLHLVSNLPVIEDSAHRIEKDQCKGSKNTTCFSFYASKNMTCGEGGMITTNSKKIADRARSIIKHGITKNAYDRYAEGNIRYEVNEVGYKGNLPDILSTIALEQLRKLPEVSIRRNRVVDAYNKDLGLKNEGNHFYPILVRNQQKFIRGMKSEGIEVAVHYTPLHLSRAYSKYPSNGMKNTERIAKKIVSLPIYPQLTDGEIDYIINNVRKYINEE